MSGYPTKSRFLPKNMDKYKGDKMPIARSQWETAFFQFCDENPDVLSWSSEGFKIPYKCPITLRQTIYVPDAYMKFRDSRGAIREELIEIKPAHEAIAERVKDDRDAANYVRNQAKWDAAAAWAHRRNISFRVMTEHELFGEPLPKPGAKRPTKAKPTTRTKMPTPPTRPIRSGQPSKANLDAHLARANKMAKAAAHRNKAPAKRLKLMSEAAPPRRPIVRKSPNVAKSQSVRSARTI